MSGYISLTAAAPSRDSTVSTTGMVTADGETMFHFVAPKSGKALILFENNSSSAPVLSVLAGTGLHASQGNLSLTLSKATGKLYVVGPLSLSRFKSMSGTTAMININMATPCTTGKIAVVAVP
jgi:hypothetical protein